jgi:hypothetical protein
MQLCEFLFDELYSRGVRQIFGIPGDFVLNLYEALEKYAKFRLLTLSHEPAVGFAADAAARITNGLGVCLVTYGAGGLNMVNSVACAYAEKSPGRHLRWPGCESGVSSVSRSEIPCLNESTTRSSNMEPFGQSVHCCWKSARWNCLQLMRLF